MQYNVTRATTTLFSYTVYNSVQFYYYFTFITCSLTVLPHAAVFFPLCFVYTLPFYMLVGCLRLACDVTIEQAEVKRNQTTTTREQINFALNFI